MTRRRRSNNRQEKTRMNLIVVCCILLVILVALICIVIGLGGDEKPQISGTSSSSTSVSSTVPAKELVVQKVEEQGDTVIVTTSYGVIKYPYAFSDLIRIETETHGYYAQMDFSAVVDNEEVMLYTVFFNKHTGIPVGTLTVDGTAYVVTAVVHDLSNVSEQNRMTFQAAQETFNDVMMSLEENAGFTAAQ